MDTFRQDVRYAARLLLRAPVFTLVTALTLAVGIGGTTIAFSLANAVLLRRLPVPEPDRVVQLANVVKGGPGSIAAYAYPDYVAYRDRADVFTDLAASGPGAFGLSTDGPADAVSGAYASGNYFRALGIRPALGRFFTPEEDRVGGDALVVVLSHALWRERFAADPGVLGRVVKLSGHPATIVGVAPEGFEGTSLGSAPELWVPIAARATLMPGMVERPGSRLRISWLEVVGRLKPGVTPERAESELTALARNLPSDGPRPFPVMGVRLSAAGSAPPAVRGVAFGVLALLLGTAGLVLLIASTNVAGMLLARASARRREIAVRLAMGARPARVVRQLVTESVLLALLGGAGGLLTAYWAAELLRTFNPPIPIPSGRISLDITPDARVLLVALAISLGSGVLFGLAPALQATRPALVPALRDATPGAGRRSRLRDAMVVGQIALSLLLLLSAGLFLRSLQRAVKVDPGFRPEGVAVAGVDLDALGYTPETGTQFYRTLLERLRATPGVESASLAFLIPLSGAEMRAGARVPGQEAEGVQLNVVGDGYFHTLRIPLLRGREFTPQDGAGTPLVAVVNETFARHYWPGEDALGKRFELTGEGTLEVVGVVKDTKVVTLGERPAPMAYRPVAQSYQPRVTLHVRAAGGNAEALVPTVRRVVQEENPAVALGGAGTMNFAIAVALLPQKVGAAVAGSFGLIGLLLAAVGLYGTMAYAVSQRTREIGIRTALGADPRATLRLVLRQAARIVGVGVLVGTVLGLVATRFLAGLLFGVSPTDPVAFLGVTSLLLAVALAASVIPARRAVRVDPMVALRSE